MGTSVGVGYSLLKNPADAGRQAVQQALQQGGMEQPDFVFLFATIGYQQQLLLDAVCAATHNPALSGCTGEGIIVRGFASESNFGVCVMAIASDELRFTALVETELGLGFERAGERLAEQVRPLLSDQTFACLLFADGLVFDFDPFKEGFERALQLARPLPLFGGLSADNWTAGKTFQYHNGRVFSQSVSCVLLSGSGKVAWGVNHGCVPVGTQHTITRSKGNVICGIDGVPALDALEEYVENPRDQWNKITLNLCLGFRTPEYLKQEYGDFLIRYMMDKDDVEGCVTIQSDVAEGTELWIMRRDKELMYDGLQEIVRQVRARLGSNRPKLVLHFECMGRGKAVYQEQEKLHLLQYLQEEIGADIPWIGFYSYGEIGPVSEHNCIHNFTAIVMAVY
ncbi:FIST C-terminal domain-containing protein [Geomonas paludis]|uniref:FIST C-terminal domain-containing protein n=1 Tax=Geomonas paludis TaxID=2740185 RepID=A0A6V8MQC7_9BACT|nr:FIST N-terminal domain-containing protein [Geomonas paludis]UPU36169.1 FIST C-terminal domain-containing protein [Geomonas paludis]GFO62221.1 histidine kinase [Geomonas paludis]